VVGGIDGGAEVRLSQRLPRAAFIARHHCDGRAELAARAELAGARGRRVSHRRLARSWRVAGAGEGRAPLVVSRGVGGGGHHGRGRTGEEAASITGGGTRGCGRPP
jgi:hypothetical protein